MSELEQDHPFSFELITDVHCYKHGFATYRRLADEIDDMLHQKENQIGEQLKSALSRAPEREHSDVHESYALDFRDCESFHLLQRQAMFLTLYNYFEHALNKTCEAIGTELQSRTKLKDLRDKGVERALLFLKLVPGFEFTGSPGVLNEIRGANALRNVVVHAGAVLPGTPQERVNQYVKSHPELTGEPGGSVEFQKGFVPAFVETSQSFFVALETEMQSYMNRTWRKPTE